MRAPLSIQLIQRLAHFQRCLHGAIGVIRIPKRRAEQRHQRVADVFVDDPAVRFHDAAHAREVMIKNREHVVGVERFAHGREIAQIGKQNRYFAFFATERDIFAQ